MRAHYIKYNLHFKVPSATSRSILHAKWSYFIIISNLQNPSRFGVGEAAPLEGLSIDARDGFEDQLKLVCNDISSSIEQLNVLRLKFPSIAFALECAYTQYMRSSDAILFPSAFTASAASIPINGLIWIGNLEYMKMQINEKIKEAYSVLKLKIGANAFEEEIQILRWIRREYKNENLVIRLDANGAFTSSEAAIKIEQLSQFDIHSIEQPIKQGQVEEMAALCEKTAIPIALDEELIKVVSMEEKIKLLHAIRPQFIILKPTLHGGFVGCEEWINCARSLNIPFWITSALESNIGLNAIAQWTFLQNSSEKTHGLGTGQLYTNNIDSPLHIEEGCLFFDNSKSFDYTIIER